MPDGARIDGWKAIGNFLGRDRTTVIRWARERGLPVHRVPGGRTGTIYAVRSELEAWLSRDEQDTPDPVRAKGPPVQRAVTVPTSRKRWLAGTLLAVLGLAAVPVFIGGRTQAPANGPVTLSAVASPRENPETLEFARSLNADLARFANATPGLAVYEGEPGAVPATQYAVRTEIERANGKMTANARLIATPKGEVIWSRRFEQSGPAPSELREKIASKIVTILRCSFGGLGNERFKVNPTELAQLIAICQNFDDSQFAAAQARAQHLTTIRPDLALGWAMLAMAEALLAEEGDVGSANGIITHANRAASIAPGNMATQMALAAATSGGPTHPKALAAIENAIRMHPDEPDLLIWQSVLLFNLGYLQAAVQPALASVQNDPSSLSNRDSAARRLAAAGRLKEALQLQQENERLWPGHPMVVENRSRIFSEGARRPAADRQTIAEYKHLFEYQPSAAYMLARLYERNGNRAEALKWLVRAPIQDTQIQWSLLFWPDAAGLRAEPAFFRKMAELGFVKIWIERAKWPDFCAEPGLKYDCAVEAAKLGLRANRSS